MKRNIAALFFLSGITGLIYQLLWVRKFTYLFGSAYLTVSIIVASFMAGLLAGAWIIGKMSGRIQHPIRWYGWMEVFIGVYALLFIAAAGSFDAWFGGIVATAAGMAWLQIILKSLLILLLLLPPTAAMGATLPLLVQQFTKEISGFRSSISLFYAINTFGAAAGVLMAGFYLIEHFGINAGIGLAGVMNVLIGLAALAFSAEAEDAGRKGVGPEELKHTPNAETDSSAKVISGSLLLTTAFLSGFIALSLEVIWTRVLKFLIQSSTYSFAIILFVFLLGIAVGGRWSERLMRNSKSLLRHYGICQMVQAIGSLFTIIFLYHLAYADFFQQKFFNVIFDFSSGWFSGILIYVLTCGLAFLLPAIMMGVLFPILNQLYYSLRGEAPGKVVSSIYSINTLGSIAGALISGFILIPLLGLKWSIALLSVASFAIGCFFLLKSKERWRLKEWSIAALFVVMFIPVLQSGRLSSREEVQADNVVYYQEGLSATVKVYESKRSLNMSIDGMNIASTSPALLQKEMLIAHLPFFIHAQIQSALSVGLASGISTAAIAAHAGVKRVDCVELIKPVFEASRFFTEYNHNVQTNPKVQLINDDIFAYLKFSEQKYDVISSDGKLGTLDNANTTMLSSDYYEQCRKRLNPGGIFIQWIPLITPTSCFDVILHTMKQSFQHVSVFYFYPSDVFMIGTENPIQLQLPQMNRVMEQKAIREDLASAGIGKASELMCGYAGEYVEVHSALDVNSMNKPVLEFLFYRDWKKADELPGGYRAENLRKLTGNFAAQSRVAATVYLGLPRDEYARGIYESSLNFFSFCIDNFRQGSYEAGLKEYERFRQSIPF